MVHERLGTYFDIYCIGMFSAAASLGLSLLWDTDVGLSHVDKYTYSHEEYIKASTNRFHCEVHSK